MVGRKTVVSLVALVVCVVALLALSGTTEAQTPAPAPVLFQNVQVFTYPSGLTAFFDSSTGMLYVYDKNWDKCVSVRRLNQLGAPLADVTPRR